MNPKIKCPNCKGSGERGEQTIYHGEEGMRIEEDVPMICDMCHGDKEVTQEQIDEYNEQFEEDYTEPTDPRQQPWE